jgi:tetratricopeptide (TPR) repeat protein
VAGILVLATALGFSIAVRARNYPNRALFHSDAALRYRYAEMVGQGRPVPVVDSLVQAPEGLRVRALDFILEDVVAGSVFRLVTRLAPTLAFSVYLKWFVCLCSSLMVLIVYLLGSALWQSRAAGVLSASFYAASLPSFERVLGNYLREEFTLPFIFLSLYCFMRALAERAGSRRAHVAGLGAGVFVFLALSSWHLSSFYLLCFMVAAGLVLFWSADFVPVVMPLRYVVAFTVLAGLVNEPLRGKAFLISPPVMLGACLLLVAAGYQRLGFSRRVAGALVVALAGLLIGTAMLLAARLGQFGHVYSLVLAKLKFLGVKPTNPELLPIQARLLWLGPFQSPSLASFLQGFAVVSLAALYPLARLAARAWRRLATRTEVLVLLFTPGFFLLYLLVSRLEVLAIVFVTLLLGGSLVLTGRRQRRALFAGLLLLLAFEVTKAAYYPRLESRVGALAKVLRGSKARSIETLSLQDTDKSQIFSRIKAETPRDAVFLARFAVSPMIAAYAGRAVVLQSVFEDNWIRQKVLECMAAYYGSESTLYALCRKYRVTHVLYEANQLLDNGQLGDRYIVDKLRLPTDCVAVTMHFRPESLRCFTPIFQTEYFRVFQVRDQPGDPASCRLPYALQYDPEIFAVDQMGDTFSDSLEAAGWKRISEIMARNMEGDKLVQANRLQDAADAYREALVWAPRQENVRLSLAACLWQIGRIDLAAQEYERLLQTAPENAEALCNLGIAYAQQGATEKAIAQFEKALNVDPKSVTVLINLALIYERAGQPERAIGLLEQARAIDPLDRRVQVQLTRLRNPSRPGTASPTPSRNR